MADGVGGAVEVAAGTEDGAGDAAERGEGLTAADTEAFGTEVVGGTVVVTTPLLAVHLHP